MYKQPKIFIPKNNSDRAYVLYYFNGKRIREYNGNRLNLSINPNHCDNPKDRKQLLLQLQFEVTKALNNGWNPFDLNSEPEQVSLREGLALVIKEKQNTNLCDLYKRNLIGVHRMFIEHVPEQYLKAQVDRLPLSIVETFLNRFQSSERNYINRRRCLQTLFNELVRKDFVAKNIVNSTKTVRAKASLHAPYSEPQLKLALSYLKANYPNLHLCCLLTYGCLLRPHHEIRLLKRKHVVNDYEQIQLSGSENKSKRIRTVYIPAYIKDELRDRLDNINDPEANIFTFTKSPYNIGYFNVMWGKAKIELIKEGILTPKQTIYSFRHTAAINVYRRTKDLHILQQLLQHSNMIVTLNYLRGLGEINDERLKDALPEL
jgi:integrase